MNNAQESNISCHCGSYLKESFLEVCHVYVCRLDALNYAVLQTHLFKYANMFVT